MRRKRWKWNREGKRREEDMMMISMETIKKKRGIG